MSVSPCIAFGLVFSCLLAGNSRAGQFGLFTYEITSATTVSIIDYPDDATGPVVIPASIDGRSVTEIGSAAFSEAVGIVSVEIPNSIVTINNDAFALCTSLASVTFAPASSVTSLGPAVFNGCSALTSISIPSGVERIEDMLFRGCSSLTHVSLPSGVESIGEESFGNCIVLGNFTFPASLTSIGNSAFETCDGLTDVRLPANLTSLGPFAFFDCDGLTTVSIPASVTSIGNSAFVYVANNAFLGEFGTTQDLIEIEIVGNNVTASLLSTYDAEVLGLAITGVAPFAGEYWAAVSLASFPPLAGFGKIDLATASLTDAQEAALVGFPFAEIYKVAFSIGLSQSSSGKIYLNQFVIDKDTGDEYVIIAEADPVNYETTYLLNIVQTDFVPIDIETTQ
jgi:hypothetical protein